MIEDSKHNQDDYQNGDEDINDYITDSYKVNIKQGILKYNNNRRWG